MSVAIEKLVESARAAAASHDATAAVRVLLRDLIADPHGLARDLGDLGDADEAMLFEDDGVSIWHCRFWPGREVPPHEHLMPAFIGVYRGEEANTFYRRGAGRLEAVKTRRIGPGEVLSIGRDGVHSVCAAGDGPSYAVHIYLGPLSRVERALFRWESGESLPFTDENFKALTRSTPSAAG